MRGVIGGVAVVCEVGGARSCGVVRCLALGNVVGVSGTWAE